MASEKVFVVVEAVDRPVGAMSVRYQVVERVEEDPEEERIHAAENDQAMKNIPAELRDDFMAQMEAAKAMMGVKKKTIYRAEERVVICVKPEEVTAAIVEARENYDEMKRLKKTGAQFEFSTPRMGLY